MKKTKKEWNWPVFKSKVSPQRYEWIFQNHKKTVSEAEYIEALRTIKEFRAGPPKNYSPSRLSKEYRNLRDTFGFFIQTTGTPTTD